MKTFENSDSTFHHRLYFFLGVRGFQQLTGIVAIIYYSKTIFEESEEFISSSTASILYALVQLLLTSFCTSIVDIAGRRPLLITSFIGTALALLGNASYLYVKHFTAQDVTPLSFVPLLALLSYVIMLNVGVQSIPFLITSELFPTNVKAFASFIMELEFAALLAVVSKFFHWSRNSLGMHMPFLAFGVYSIIGAIFVIFFVPETKGKSLEDIQKEL